MIVQSQNVYNYLHKFNSNVKPMIYSALNHQKLQTAGNDFQQAVNFL